MNFSRADWQIPENQTIPTIQIKIDLQTAPALFRSKQSQQNVPQLFILRYLVFPHCRRVSFWLGLTHTSAVTCVVHHSKNRFWKRFGMVWSGLVSLFDKHFLFNRPKSAQELSAKKIVATQVKLNQYGKLVWLTLKHFIEWFRLTSARYTLRFRSWKRSWKRDVSKNVCHLYRSVHIRNENLIFLPFLRGKIYQNF